MLCGLIVYWLIDFIGKSDKTYWILCIQIIFWILLVIAYQMNCLDNVPYSLQALKMYPFFIMGTFFSKFKLLKNIFIHSNILLTISILSYILFFIYRDEIPIKLSFTGMFAIIILVHFFVHNDKLIPSKMSFIGRYSMEIYVFHWFFLPTLYSLGGWLSIQNTGINQNIIILFCITLVIAIPIIFVCILLSNIIQRSILLNAVCFGGNLQK